MYGSVGTYSAGSTGVWTWVRIASIGGGGGLSGSESYTYTATEIGAGGGVEEVPWGVFTSVLPIGGGGGVEELETVIGTITKSASIGGGGGLQEMLTSYGFDVTPIGGGGGVEDLPYALIVSGSIGGGGGLEAEQVIGTLTFTIEEIGAGGGIEVFSQEILLQGVPKFVVTPVSGNFEIEVLNRNGKEVKIFRTDQHNTADQTVIEINADTYSDPIISGKNYRYKLAFFIDLSPQVVGQKSIYKIGKA